jgi:CRISPR system Cascade subunit CasE
MFLHRIHLNPRSKEARRDLANPYELHSTLCRAFSPADQKCPEGAFLWRLEPETSVEDFPKLLIQSSIVPDWHRIGLSDWLGKNPEPAVDLKARLKLEDIKTRKKFRFRLRANPSVVREKKRQGLLQTIDQEHWLVRKGLNHGFSLPYLSAFEFDDAPEKRPDVRISQEQMLRGRRHEGTPISIFSVLFDGILVVDDTEKFVQCLHTGIGHGKAMGLGLLSLAPIG